MLKAKKNIAVLFGSRSVEHEISIITSLQLMQALDTQKYNVIPVYIAPDGHWFSGDLLFRRNIYRNFSAYRNQLKEVQFIPTPDCGGLRVVANTFSARLSELFADKPEIIDVDVYLLGFHGEYGEDGCIQGMLELADVAYSSSDVLSSALAMNKYLCKSVLRDHGIEALPSAIVKKFDAVKDLNQQIQKIRNTKGLENFPLFIKPNHLGSSVGIGKAENEDELIASLARVFLHDSEAIIEPCLDSMFEINVSVLASEPPRASVVEIPVSSSGALSYEDKYMREGGKKKGALPSEGMASLTRDINPQHLDPSIKEYVRSCAIKAYDILNCCGAVRFDFMHDNKSGKIYFNELNPQPGSLSFYLWIKSEPPLLYTEELDIIIEAAERRRKQLSSRQKHIGFKALR